MARYTYKQRQKAISIAEESGASEASKVTGIPPGTIRSWLHRMRTRGSDETQRNDEAQQDTLQRVATQQELKKMTKRKDDVGLTDKQRIFCQEYIVDLNATQAAIRAGYSESSAGSIGQENLTKPAIQAAIQRAMDERQSRTEITQDRVINELARIAFSDLCDFVEFDKNGVSVRDSQEVDGRVVAEISERATRYGRNKRIKLHDKIKALEMLGKHLGLFNDKLKLEHTGTDGGPIDLRTWVDMVVIRDEGHEE